MMETKTVFLAVLAYLALVQDVIGAKFQVDPKGYVIYCPCMGRFGNQADHFLGAIAFAKGLDRTFVVPPWIEYVDARPNAVAVPFKKYFKVEALEDYHRVIPMEDFMEHIAPEVWPPERRIAFCHSPRQGTKEESCNAKDGSPFGPFWDTFNIDFIASAFYSSLHYSTFRPEDAESWDEQFPPSEHPVLSFTGAPAAFPVREENWQLQKFLVWSDEVMAKADRFLEEKIQERPFLGLHMRNGNDWMRACRHAGTSPNRNMFGSANCLGYRMEHGQMSEELCLPPEETVLSQVKKTVKKMKAKTVFVASDDDPMIAKLEKTLKKDKIKVVRQKENNPHVDLAILGKADHYIGNCVSTFSAFATRQRRVNDKSVDFWAFKSKVHDEL